MPPNPNPLPAGSQLSYKVVKCTSEDAQYPVSELLAASPNTRGWQTAPHCEYPAEVGLEFDSPVHLRQVKFLSHQTKIATKIELFTSLPLLSEDGEVETHYAACSFKRLGYLSLDSNERSQFQARELKTVDVDIRAQYLKILFHKCHMNRFNASNQVGLIALYCVGDVLDPSSLPREPSLVAMPAVGTPGVAVAAGAGRHSPAGSREDRQGRSNGVPLVSARRDSERQLEGPADPKVHPFEQGQAALSVVPIAPAPLAVAGAGADNGRGSAIAPEKASESPLLAPPPTIASAIAATTSSLTRQEDTPAAVPSVAGYSEQTASPVPRRSSQGGPRLAATLVVGSSESPPLQHQQQQPQLQQRPHQLQTEASTPAIAGSVPPADTLTADISFAAGIAGIAGTCPAGVSPLTLPTAPLPSPSMGMAASPSLVSSPSAAGGNSDRLDGQIQEQLRRLNEAKQEAVDNEDYDEAKRLKLLLLKIQQVGPQLRELELKKRQAVEGEDFDTAKSLKVEIQKLRSWVEDPQRALAAEEESTTSQPPTPSSSVATPASSALRQPPNGVAVAEGGGGGGVASNARQVCGGQRGIGQRGNSPPADASSDATLAPHQQPQHHASVVASLVSALASKQTPGGGGGEGGEGGQQTRGPRQGAHHSNSAKDSIEMNSRIQPHDHFEAEHSPPPPSAVEADHPFASVPNFEDRGPPEPLAAAVTIEASPLIPLFGEYITCALYSKTWNLRDAALQKLTADLGEELLPGSGLSQPQAAFSNLVRSLGVVLKRTLADKNVQVFTAAAGLLQALCQAASCLPQRLGEAKAAIEPLLPILADRLGDSNARADHTTREAHLFLARWNDVSAQFAAQCLLHPPAKRTVPPRVWSSRLQLLFSLLAEAGLQPEDPDGLPLDPIMKMAMECFSNRDADVREAAVRLVAACVALVGIGRIEKYLSNLRNSQREVFDAEFERVNLRGASAYLCPAGVHPPSGGRFVTCSTEVLHHATPPPPSAMDVSSHQHQTFARTAGAVRSDCCLEDDDVADIDEFTCEFCDRHDPSFTEEALDVHYWRECPMLTECQLCTQVIEISRLHAHLLDECEVKDRATAAGERLAAHCCPLCGMSMGRCTEGEWRQHLLRALGCPRNPRGLTQMPLTSLSNRR